MSGLDRSTLMGVVMCAVPVATYSAYSQFETARMTNVPWQLAWVLPVTTDATGFVATRVWLNPDNNRGVQRYAAFIALLCIGLSFAGAAIHLALAGASAPWWLRLAVGGLPSLALAALVHLGAILAKQGRDEEKKTAPRRESAKKTRAPKTASAVEPVISPTSTVPASIPDIPTETAFPLNPTPVNATSVGSAPEVGAGSKRAQMLAYLDQHGEVAGVELDRLFNTKDYGRGVLATWRKRHPQASGE